MIPIYRLIRLNSLVASYPLKAAAILAADVLGMRTLCLRMDPVLGCNPRCLMCHFSDPEVRRETTGRFSDEELERIGTLFFRRTLQLVVGCGAEPTLHTALAGIVRNAKQTHKVPSAGLVTNGQLLTRRMIEELAVAGLDELTVSVHGVRRQTYERFMVNASHEKLLTVLGDTDCVAGGAQGSRMALRINYTVNPDNLEELAGFFDVYGRFRIKVLQVRPMVALGNSEYRRDGFSGFGDEYRVVMGRLADECRKRGVVLIANVTDPEYRAEGRGVSVMPLVYRYVSPTVVWKPDFKWREETYREYCRRTGWRNAVLRSLFRRDAGDVAGENRLNYDIKLP